MSVRGQRTEREKQKQKERQKKRNGGKETEKERQNEIDRKREREEKRETEEERQEKRDRKRGQTHHSFRSVKVLLARLSAGGSVLFVLLAVLLLLYNRSAFSALWWVLEDEGAQLVSGVQHAAVSTGFTGITDGLFLGVHMQVGLRVVTLGTQNKLPDESVQHVL